MILYGNPAGITQNWSRIFLKVISVLDIGSKVHFWVWIPGWLEHNSARSRKCQVSYMPWHYHAWGENVLLREFLPYLGQSSWDPIFGINYG